MATRRTFRIPVSTGLFEHYLKIEESIWFFLWAIDKTTKEIPDPDEPSKKLGVVLGGTPQTDEEIAKSFPGVSTHTFRRYRTRLVREGYLKQRRTPCGHVLWVKNSQKWLNGGAEGPSTDGRSQSKRAAINGRSPGEGSSKFADGVATNVEGSSKFADPIKTRQDFTETNQPPTAAGWLSAYYGQTVGKPLPMDKKVRTQLQALADKDGIKTFQKVCQHWLKNRSLDGLRYPVWKLIEEYDGSKQAVKSTEPEYSAEEIQAAIDRNVKERQAEVTQTLAEIARKKELEAVNLF